MTSPHVPPVLLKSLADQAAALDRGTLTTRSVLTDLAEAGLLDLGAPDNTDGQLSRMLTVLEDLARCSLSAAFSVWSHRATIEFLTAADTAFARSILDRMRTGGHPGVSAMASGFRQLVGLGRADLTAVRTGDGYSVWGRLPWASNLYPDAVVVTTIRDEQDRPAVVGFPLDAAGVQVHASPDLMALQGTASSSLSLDGMILSDAQVLSQDFRRLLARVRPVFSVLQSAFCIGLAAECHHQAQQNLGGVNDTYANEVMAAGRQLSTLRSQLHEAARSIGSDRLPAPRHLLQLRLEAGQLAGVMAGLEIKTTGGRGFTLTSDANRRYREAAFIALQSPSEAQLRTELTVTS